VDTTVYTTVDDSEGKDFPVTDATNEASDASSERRPAGELEASVLAALWAADEPQTARQIQRAVPMDLARTTVATILSRLHEKGAVSRRRSGRGYAYSPAQDTHGLTARRMHLELDKDSNREVVLARFISQLGTEDERVLRELLEAADQ
jgi:predicted transcriptional regulator